MLSVKVLDFGFQNRVGTAYLKIGYCYSLQSVLIQTVVGFCDIASRYCSFFLSVLIQVFVVFGTTKLDTVSCEYQLPR